MQGGSVARARPIGRRAGYEEMDTYKVTAITTWSVEWSVAGQPGVIETATRSSRDVLIGEYQAVNVKPGR